MKHSSQFEFERLMKLGWNLPRISTEGFYVPRVVDESKISFPSASWETSDSEEDASSFWAVERASLIYRLLNHHNVTTLWEIGAGNGTAAIPLRELGLEVFTVEPLKSGAATLYANNFEVFHSTLEDLKLPENSIDAFGAFDVLEHLENPEILLNEIFRALKNAVKDFLSEYCTKVRKNESEATTELWLISHRCITVNGKQYYIPKAYGHDEATNIIQTYLYDNFQI